MRCILQRVDYAKLFIDKELYSIINKGLLVYVCLEARDSERDYTWFLNKIINLKIFTDTLSEATLSLKDIDGELLIVSNFTLFAKIKKGYKPSYSSNPEAQISYEHAHKKYQEFLSHANALYNPQKLKTGKFGAAMVVEARIDGPINLIIDSPEFNN